MTSTQTQLVADRIAALTGLTVYCGQVPDLVPCVALVEQPAGPTPDVVDRDYDYPSFTLYVRGTQPQAVYAQAIAIAATVHRDRHAGGIVLLRCAMPTYATQAKTSGGLRVSQCTVQIDSQFTRNECYVSN